MTKKVTYSAFDCALNIITYKDRSKSEVERKLKDKGYTNEEVSLAIDKLIEYGYIDDTKYVNTYIRSNIMKKGTNRMINELLNNGVDKSIIQEQLSQYDYDEVDIIYDIINQRFLSIDLSNQKEKAKAYNYLARRGFSFSDISRAFNLYISDR